ncbi:MAG TPA: response regulator [Candidatus Polarisedimenticolia bacterium]|nr:response regulator [Candidatus Polarisedimenticolia bacterium]
MMTILLIDDSAGVRAVLSEALAIEGYKVLEASDGAEGVRLYREHRPGLALVDMIMPEKDGIETVKEILEFDPDAVIFTFSGKDAGGDHQETARILGAKKGFQKPLRVEVLLAAIRESLGDQK